MDRIRYQGIEIADPKNYLFSHLFKFGIIVNFCAYSKLIKFQPLSRHDSYFSASMPLRVDPFEYHRLGFGPNF